MIGWRIARAPHADLSGAGGLYASGRWHNRGRPILYAADHPALAMLEVRVHFDLPPDLMPDDYVLMQIAWQDELSGQDFGVKATQILQDQQHGSDEQLRALGDDWLKQNQNLIAQVPSIIVPHCRNYLINPVHPELDQLRLITVEPIEFDQRLFAHS